jgi:uncharacterized lipoprotein YbaY
MSRSLIACVLTVVIGLSGAVMLGGCGQKKETKPPAPPAAPAETPKKSEKATEGAPKAGEAAKPAPATEPR